MNFRSMILRISLIVIVLGIAWLSLTPKETITIGNDKISHFIAYGVLMLNIGLLTYEHKKTFVWGALAAVVYGGLLEVGQHFVPGRMMSFYDLIANTGGVVCGVLLTIFLYTPLRNFLRWAGLFR